MPRALGNPSDPEEEAERVGKALQNLQDWQNKFGGFSGGVRMPSGRSKVYEVPIGQPEIASKVMPTTIAALPQAASSAVPASMMPSGPVVHFGDAPSQKPERVPRHPALRWLFNLISTEK